MKGYKIYFDEETEKFCHESDLSEVGKEGDKTTRDGLYPIWSDTLAHARTAVNSLNDDVESGRISMIRCKTCGNRFILTLDEVTWFENRGLKAPVRCPSCRKKRKVAIERERERIKELELEEREA